MNTIVILGLTFLIGSLIAAFGHYYFYQRKKKHAKSLVLDLKNFNLAVKNEDFIRMDKYGKSLLWNVHLDMELLDKISEIVDANITEHSILKDLKLLIYNKQSNWNSHSRF